VAWVGVTQPGDSSGSLACTSPPSRYQPSEVVTANVCLASWIRGRRPRARYSIPVWRSRSRKAADTVLADSRLPVLDTNSAAVCGRGHNRSRRVAYSLSAATVEAGNGNSRGLWNFASRTRSTPVSGSRSPRSSPSTSPRRRPVANTNPMNVCMLAASSGRRSRPAASIKAVMSASEYRYGVARRVRAGSRSVGGTWVAGSMACRQRAKPRTAPSRCACQVTEHPAGSVAHCSARSVVIVSASSIWAKSANCASSRPASTSWNPRPRRTLR